LGNVPTKTYGVNQKEGTNKEKGKKKKKKIKKHIKGRVITRIATTSTKKKIAIKKPTGDGTQKEKPLEEKEKTQGQTREVGREGGDAWHKTKNGSYIPE